MNRKKYFYSIVTVWFLATICSLVWNLKVTDYNLEEMMLNVGRSFFQEIETTRLWNSSHGGVYVPVTEKTRPNPYLQSQGRDITTTTGQHLTKINPAYMTRQIASIAKSNSNIQYHITSLNPINPTNKADEWETKALHTFKNGEKEIFHFFNRSKLYRYIGALPVKKACLKCHAIQNYKLGDIRGGISVTIPAKAYMEGIQKTKKSLWVIHIVSFFIGMVALYYFTSLQGKHEAEKTDILDKLNTVLKQNNVELENVVRERTVELEESKKRLQKSEEKFRKLVEYSYDWIWEVNSDGVYTYSSPQVEKILGYKAEYMIGKTPFDFMPPGEIEKIAAVFKESVEKASSIVSLENVALHKNGQYVILETSGSPFFDETGKVIGYRGIDRNITKRKKLEKEKENNQIVLKKFNEKLQNKNEQLQNALEEVKLLSGILPICSNCKKIRNDEGYWQQVEEYINNHSEAQFSHGYCPQCYETMMKKVEERSRKDK